MCYIPVSDASNSGGFTDPLMRDKRKRTPTKRTGPFSFLSFILLLEVQLEFVVIHLDEFPSLHLFYAP